MIFVLIQLCLITALGQEDEELEACNKGCVSCYKKRCYACQPGYYLDDYECYRCSYYCDTCDGGSKHDCTSCNGSDFLCSNGDCIDKDECCENDCFDCQNPEVCDECKSGYVLDSDGYCEECPPNCDSCSYSPYDDDDVIYCSDCEDGYSSDFKGHCSKHNSSRFNPLILALIVIGSSTGMG